MLMLLLGAAGFVAVMTLVSVYSALVLAHRTDEIVANICDDTTMGLPGHA
jgi:hypothetical protein